MSAASGAPAPRALIAPAQALLDEQRDALVRLHALSGSSATQFEAVYQPLALALAGSVQRLPATGDGRQTILAARLRRAEIVLARRRGVLLPPGAEPERVARQADLWTYALFGLALLRRLAREFAPWTVALWSAEGRPLGVWRPAAAPRGPARVAGAAAYSVRPNPDPPGADWTPLVAGALLPAAGLNWLWREPDVLRAWSRALVAELPAELAPLFGDPSS